MKTRTGNLMCVIALGLLLASAAFYFIILCMGKLSLCFSGNGSSLGEGIGAACAVFILVFFSIFGLIGELAALCVGGGAIFSGKRKVSVAVGCIFVVIFCCLSLVLYAFSVVMLGNADGERGAISLVLGCYWVNIAACAYAIVAFILCSVAKNKQIDEKKRLEKEDLAKADPAAGSAAGSTDSGAVAGKASEAAGTEEAEDATFGIPTDKKDKE